MKDPTKSGTSDTRSESGLPPLSGMRGRHSHLVRSGDPMDRLPIELSIMGSDGLGVSHIGLASLSLWREEHLRGEHIVMLSLDLVAEQWLCLGGPYGLPGTVATAELRFSHTAMIKKIGRLLARSSTSRNT